jgi:hypothetical protein
MRRPGTALTRAGNNERLFNHANIATGARDVLAEECLPQTLHNSLDLHRPKLPFPLDLQDPQDGKDHNRCYPEKHSTWLSHGSISPQDRESITGLDVMGSYQDFFP